MSKNCRIWWINSGLIMTFLWLSGVIQAADSPTVYRCVTVDGRIEFRQYPCHGADTATQVDVERKSSGWVPPTPNQTKKYDNKSDKTGSQSNQSTNKKHSKKASDETQIGRSGESKKCWNKRQQIEEINWKLRQGYQADEGVKLRHRRKNYETYVREFCQ
ncbi:hypothetical protein [Thiospirillum jenense]|uniref:DUF4124 domain-containing protein n=1 Tax=Thiospirillum jenense TaxID=1653858 RepID=A0A839HGE0_9GAMM|nr:hypothetical protein [Thiospirillum jenense]MBB1126356.1 hypothetical protein [Thiospirillum jenense]